MKSPILGSSYVARSVNAAANRMVNLFPEVVPEAGKEPAFLQRCPGLDLLATVGVGPIRGLQVMGNFLYVVSGDTLYRLDTDYNITTLGTIAGFTEPVSIANDGVYLFIACDGPSYTFNVTTNVFAQITDPDFEGAKTVTFLDGYFIFNVPNTQRIYVTALNDPTSIDATEDFPVEGSPDNLVTVIADHSELWLFGENSVEVFYNSGNVDFPFQRIQGAYNELGCAATFSVAKLDNALFWLGADSRGKGIVYRAQGYSGLRISTHAIEWQIQQYDRIDDAVGYTYQQDGHSFYVLNFPSANATWVFDVSTGAWHERASWDNGSFIRHRVNNQTMFNGKITLGDYANGNLYTYDMNVHTDFDRTQRWLRSWRALPQGQNDLKRTAQHSLQLDIESGVGLNNTQVVDLLATDQDELVETDTGFNIQVNATDTVGSNPQVMLRWSDDGGHTWSNEHWRSIGKIGEYGKRVIWRRLGMTTKLRDRVYEISGTDPVKIAIMGAELIISPTNA
jgi:hypothetical protein